MFLMFATCLIDIRLESKFYWFLWSTVPLYIAAQIWIHRKFGDRERDLLRDGIATVAYVDEIEPTQEGFFVRFVYKNSRGDELRKSVQIPTSVFQERQITNGSQVTLLVSPDGENHVLPYFLASKYRVVPVEATQVSETISARIAAQEIALPVQSFGHLGTIEPEFCGTTPHQVRFTQKQLRHFWRLTACVPFVFGLVDLLWVMFSKRMTEDAAMVMFFIGPMIAGIFPSPFASIHERHLRLRRDIATRAVVNAVINRKRGNIRVEKHPLEFSYTYETLSGKSINGSFTLPQKRAWQLGLAKGATFTVLYNPSNHADNQPYFLITGVEIVGAMGARITPP